MGSGQRHHVAKEGKTETKLHPSQHPLSRKGSTLPVSQPCSRCSSLALVYRVAADALAITPKEHRAIAASMHRTNGERSRFSAFPAPRGSCLLRPATGVCIQVSVETAGAGRLDMGDCADPFDRDFDQDPTGLGEGLVALWLGRLRQAGDAAHDKRRVLADPGHAHGRAATEGR